MSTLVDAYVHVHAEAIQWWTLYIHGCRIGKVCKLHQVFQLVVCGDRAILQHICHICRAQHIQLSSHLQVVYRSLHPCIEVYVCFAISFRAKVLFRIYEQEVFSLHLYVGIHIVEI